MRTCRRRMRERAKSQIRREIRTKKVDRLHFDAAEIGQGEATEITAGKRREWERKSESIEGTGYVAESVAQSLPSESTTATARKSCRQHENEK